jgi:hypothetical protein
MQMNARPTTIEEIDNDHCIAVWHHTVICIWRSAPSVAMVQHLTDVCNQLLADKKPVSWFSIVERTSGAPAGPVRDAFATWTKQIVSKLAKAVIIAEGSPFRSAIVRGVGVALTAVMPRLVPFTIVTSVEDGLAQVAEHLDPSSGGVDALRREVAELRRHFDTRHPPPV